MFPDFCAIANLSIESIESFLGIAINIVRLAAYPVLITNTDKIHEEYKTRSESISGILLGNP